ncbi:MAG TPA: hypothetical protein VH020_07190 [Stellaceae bacterium]|nr:hypothetical protein [Stellaceae bacterium]
MPRILAVVAVLAWLIPLADAHAFQNEPTGFRGIPWGTPVDQVRAKKETWFNRDIGLGLTEYRSRDDLSMSGIPLTYNLYQFYKGKFSTGIMEGYASQCGSIMGVLVARFGQPDQKLTERRFVWHGRTTNIVYICNRRQDYCRVGLESTALLAERERDIANDAAKGSDF